VAMQQIRVPHVRGYDFGVGADRLSGSAMNQVVKPTPSEPMLSGGGTHRLMSTVSAPRAIYNSAWVSISRRHMDVQASEQELRDDFPICKTARCTRRRCS
jgi:hypothetical protein